MQEKDTIKLFEQRKIINRFVLIEIQNSPNQISSGVHLDKQPNGGANLFFKAYVIYL